MMTFWVTSFDTVFANSCRGEDMSLREFAELIKTTQAAKKGDLPLVKLARFGTVCTLDKSYRHDGNVVTVSGAEGDYDGGEMPFDEAVWRLEATGIAFLICTTPSHCADRPRWRVFVPFSRELPAGLRAKMVDRLNGVLGGVLSRESWPLSQAFYAGVVTGVPFDIVVCDSEEYIDEADELDATAMPYRAPKPTTGKPDYKQLDEVALFELITTGQSYYGAATELIWRWARRGIRRETAEEDLCAAFDRVPPQQQQDKKWRKGRAAIPRWVERTYGRAAALGKRPRGSGRPLAFVRPTPWPEAVDGAGLLDALVEMCLRYVVMLEMAAHVVALWILHTYVFPAVMITPRLLLKSAEKRSGKTTLLMLVEATASRALIAANMSAAAVYRTVENAQPTLLIDEADTFLPNNEGLRGVLNAGYMRGGQVIRTVGDNHEPRVFSCWCPAAIAAIKKLPDTIEDRSVAITLVRRRKDEKVMRLRLDRLALLTPLVSQAQRWADDNIAAIETADPEVPNQLNDRAADCWRVLIAIADLAGKHWPVRAREAAVALALTNEDIETVLTQLLSDLRDIFEISGYELFSGQIVESLGGMENRPWPEMGKRRQPITKVQLSRLLAPLKIRPRDIHRGTLHGKGYKREQFADAFERYLA